MTKALKRWIEYCRQNDFAILGTMIVLAFAMSLLAGCRGGEGQPVVTDDDLTPNSAVQDALTLDAGNGKNYPYFWAAEDEASFEALAGRFQADYECACARVQKLIDEGAEELQQDLDDYREWYAIGGALYEERMQRLREELPKERALDPVIGPQEAANITGRVLEEMYGIDTDSIEIILKCYKADETAAIRYEERMVWKVYAARQPGMMDETNMDIAFRGIFDATTGEWVSAIYHAGLDEMDAAISSPAAPAFKLDPEGQFGRWDVQDPAYAEALEQMKTEAAQALAQSVLMDGAAVTEIEVADIFPNTTCFRVSMDNGKSYTLERNSWTEGHLECDNSGYPLRCYAIFKDEAGLYG